jgi:hypothetical protein
VKHLAPTGPLTGAELAAALLPKGAFRSGLVSSGAVYSRAVRSSTSATPIASSDCAGLTSAFIAGTWAQSYASEQLTEYDSSDGAPDFGQAALQYPGGLAAAGFKAFRAMLAGPCASFSDSRQQRTDTVTEVTGLGDEAFLDKNSMEIDNIAPLYTYTLFARYGDVVVSATIKCSLLSMAEGYDLAGKVSQIAAAI